MSTTIQNAGNMTFQGAAAANQVTTVQEAQGGQRADGSHAPPGTTPAVVVPGDTISGIMSQQGLDWNNPEQREQFLRDNPQFSETGDRNPDLIWPGEVIYVRTSTPEQATDKAVSDLATLEEQHGETGPGSSVNAAEHRAEVLGEGQQAVQNAAMEELASGATADEILARYGGENAPARVQAAVREAATDHAAQQLLAAQESGDQSAIAAAEANLKEAVKNEVKADYSSYATPNENGMMSREAYGKGAVRAGEAINQRLEQLGLTGQTENVSGAAQEVSNDINNEV